MEVERPYSENPYNSSNPPDTPPEGLGWRVLRVGTVIPLGLFSAVVKMIYHAGISMCYSFFESSEEIRNTYVQIVAKDYEETKGWFIRFYDEERGLYWIERSQSSEIVNGIRVPFAERAKEYSLDTLIWMQIDLKEDFELEVPEDFSEKLDALDREERRWLDSVSLFDLKTNSRLLEYGLCSFEEFDRISLEELNGASMNDLRFILKRLSLRVDDSHHLIRQLDQISVEQLGKIDLNDFLEIPICCFFSEEEGSSTRERFATVSSSRVIYDFDIYRLSDHLKRLVSPEQLEALELENKSDYQVELHRFFPNDVEGKERFKKLPLDLIQKLLKHCRSYMLLELDLEVLRAIDFSNLGSARYYYEIFAESEESCACFKKLSLKQKLDIQNGFELKIPTYLFACLSLDEIKAFNIGGVRLWIDKEFNQIFPNTEEGIARFKALSKEQFEEVFPNLSDDQHAYLISVITDEQLKGLKREVFSKNRSCKQALFPNTLEGWNRYCKLFTLQERLALESDDAVPYYFNSQHPKF